MSFLFVVLQPEAVGDCLKSKQCDLGDVNAPRTGPCKKVVPDRGGNKVIEGNG